jgi:hypothetical protein
MFPLISKWGRVRKRCFGLDHCFLGDFGASVLHRQGFLALTSVLKMLAVPGRLACAVVRIRTAGPAVVRTRGAASRHSAVGQGGAGAYGASAWANGSTGGSPMKKPSIWRISSGFKCNQSKVLPSFLSCS